MELGVTYALTQEQMVRNVRLFDRRSFSEGG
jgi:hypothetical protein